MDDVFAKPPPSYHSHPNSGGPTRPSPVANANLCSSGKRADGNDTILPVPDDEARSDILSNNRTSNPEKLQQDKVANWLAGITWTSLTLVFLAACTMLVLRKKGFIKWECRDTIPWLAKYYLCGFVAVATHVGIRARMRAPDLGIPRKAVHQMSQTVPIIAAGAAILAGVIGTILCEDPCRPETWTDGPRAQWLAETG